MVLIEEREHRSKKKNPTLRLISDPRIGIVDCGQKKKVVRKMKLFTHNLLVCNKKGVKDGYPLKIEAKKVDIVKTEFNQEFIKGILTKIDYDALRNAVSQTKRKF